MRTDHTFAICAYKESEYLEECIKSIKKQSLKSNIIMVTSTPNDFIKNMAKKNDIVLYINEGEGGITQDWNFAYRKANTRYITIAHQDDLYLTNYAKRAIEVLDKAWHPLIYFTNYTEIREGKFVSSNKLLRIKRLMLFPLQFTQFRKSRFVRRRILSLGSPICCPSVTFVKDNLMKCIFSKGFQSDEDWEAWEKISKLDGEFIYNPQILMGHRIHSESETSSVLKEGIRTKEDYIMLKKFWPSCIAKILTRLYAKSEKSNELSE